MKCKICGSSSYIIEYNGLIREGSVGRCTKDKVEIFKCTECETLWHNCGNSGNYYTSEEYRKSVDGSSLIEDFYKLHDAESLDKFKYCGTEKFRGKVVADIGCGGGAFLDYINTVAERVIAIEPSEEYQKQLKKKGIAVYTYAEDALKEWKEKVDVIVSFDCIEDVDEPEVFLKEAYELLSSHGEAIIGTPTDAPVMRSLLGEEYDRFLFCIQHPWILGKKSFEVMAKKIGIKNYICKFYQRYGLGNCLYWLSNRKPGKHTSYDFISKGVDELWKYELSRQELADYLVFEMKK